LSQSKNQDINEDKAKIATIKLNNYIKQVKNILEET